MKRFLAILLGCILMFSAVGVLASSEAEESHGTLEDAIQAYLDDLGFKYSYDATERKFNYGVSIESNLRNCDVVITLKDDGFTVYAYSPIGPDQSKPEQLAAVAEYIARANYGMYVGNFEMDFGDGEVRYKASARCFDRIPSADEIAILVDIPVLMIERYGNGLANVALMGADPAQMIEEAEK